MNVYLQILGYLADIGILGTYAYMLRGHSPRWFHYSNGIGAAPLVLIEALSHAWPVIPITATFGLLGWYGVYRDHAQRKRAAAQAASRSYWKNIPLNWRPATELELVDEALSMKEQM